MLPLSAAAPGTIGWLHSAILGVVEGLTEYLPVSSTAHIDLVGHWLGIADVPGFASFDIVIQLGAILAVVMHYRVLLKERLVGLVHRDPLAIRLWTALALGFLPAAIIGLLLHDLILRYLFGLVTVAAALVIGGIVMIGVEAWRKRSARVWREGLEQVTPMDGLVIGLAQCLAMIPGTSRSMATIVPGQLRGLSTATAAEFSFLLGLPTLGAATIYAGYKARAELLAHAGSVSVLIGLVISLIVALVVIAGFLHYLKRRGLEPFGYYRIVLGLVVFWVVLR